MNILTIGNLKKNYNDFTAVNVISLAVEAGEFHGILGPNGAGKSTTMNLMAVILDEAILVTTLSESDICSSVELLLQNAGESTTSSDVSVNEVPRKTLSVKNLLTFMLFKTLTASSLVGALLINEKNNRIRDRILLSGVGTGKYILGVSGAYRTGNRFLRE